MKHRDYVPFRPVVPVFYAVLCFRLLPFVAGEPARAEVIEAWVQRDKSASFRFASGNAVAFDGWGNVVMAGSYLSMFQQTNFYAARYSAGNGALLWEKSYNAPGAFNDDSATAIATDDDGNVVVTGFSGASFFNTDFYTAKYASSNGVVLWERRYNGPANASDAPTDLKIDGNGNVIVSGFSTGTNFYSDFWLYKYDFYTAKYASSNGVVLWERRYNGTGNGQDEVKGVALDGAGNVVVTGSSLGTNSNIDFYTAKYAAADGSLLWERRFNGLANNQDEPVAVAIDSKGDVVVTGYTYTNLYVDWFTTKYASEDGATIWERTYAGAAGFVDVPSAVAIDSKGDVVVTGITFFDNRNYGDFYTAKYAAGDGRLLWDVRYNGPANLDDSPRAIAVDANDNVVVTGNSGHTTAWSDYYTAKYASNDGALIWEKRYQGPLNKDERIVSKGSLAIGPAGQIAITGHANNSISSSDYGWATVVYREVLPSISVEVISSGVRLSFTGGVGGTYQVERALSVSGPWEVIASPVASASGTVEYIDVNRPPGMAFYRTRTP